MINEFTIFGERCSGTNFLEKAMIKNFKLKSTYKYGWKHFFGHSEYDKSDNTLFIGIVRDPVQWLCSLYKNPYHLNENMKKDWYGFLSSECYSIHDEHSPNKNKNQEIMGDRNIYTGERYKNIFELRKIKSTFLLRDAPQKLKNFILIKYEDLRDNYENVIKTIGETFSLVLKNREILHVNKDKHGRNYTPRIYIFPDEYIKIFNDNIDKNIEKQMGYIL